LAISQGSGGAHSSAFGAWLVQALAQWFSENQNLVNKLFYFFVFLLM